MGNSTAGSLFDVSRKDCLTTAGFAAAAVATADESDDDELLRLWGWFRGLDWESHLFFLRGW